MAVDFFEKELAKAQTRFNRVFQDLLICDLKVRQMLILAICWMGVLKRKIDNAKDRDLVREEIQKFIKYRNLINNVFNQMEAQLRIRRTYGDSDDNTKGHHSADIRR